MTGEPRRCLRRVAAVALLGVLAFTASACGDETAGPEQGATVEDITDEGVFFDSDEYLGETVRVSARVTEVLTPQSFVLAGADYGDESLLVLAATPQPEVTVGDVVQVTGTVAQFFYQDYGDDYGLVDEGIYDPYNEEEFLVNAAVDTTVPPEQ